MNQNPDPSEDDGKTVLPKNPLILEGEPTESSDPTRNEDSVNEAATRDLGNDEDSDSDGSFALSEGQLGKAAADGPTQIGVYRLLNKIGQGGMGAVWLAQQDEPVRRRVALKLIKTGRGDPQILARFDAERQALAMMEHPNIAKILDAGTSEDGAPYFVMELVQGMPLNEYSDRNKLDLRDRLALFIPICKAVQHAHQKGIIHRDLKPSNILVGMQDGQPSVKVIDFGLAKALQHQNKLTDKTLFTEFGQVLGTVRYMSPEQASLDSIDIDTRTDIYSLGVILYELLTGSTPIDAETLRQNAILKVLELIRDQDPPKPSIRLSSSEEKLSRISESRRIQPARLRKALRGDLDWIVMRALEKDRTRRYGTALGFSDDIHRYLNGDTVEARPPSTIYRTRKFVRKHRGFVSASLAILALLVFGIAGTGWFAFQENRAKENAKAEAERATMTLKLLTDSFSSVDPNGDADANMSAKDVLLNALKSLKNSQLDEIGKATILTTLSSTMNSLGEYQMAVDTAEEALAIRTRLLGRDDLMTAQSEFSLADALQMQAKLPLAAELLENVHKVFVDTCGENSFEAMIANNKLAQTYHLMGRWDEAIARLRTSIQLVESGAVVDVEPGFFDGDEEGAWLGAGQRREACRVGAVAEGDLT